MYEKPWVCLRHRWMISDYIAVNIARPIYPVPFAPPNNYFTALAFSAYFEEETPKFM